MGGVGVGNKSSVNPICCCGKDTRLLENVTALCEAAEGRGRFKKRDRCVPAKPCAYKDEGYTACLDLEQTCH